MSENQAHRDFCYWLQGYLDLTIGPTATAFSPAQVAIIQRKLAPVTCEKVFIATATHENMTRHDT